jgi:hypothetical protein
MSDTHLNSRSGLAFCWDTHGRSIIRCVPLTRQPSLCTGNTWLPTLSSIGCWRFDTSTSSANDPKSSTGVPYVKRLFIPGRLRPLETIDNRPRPSWVYIHVYYRRLFLPCCLIDKSWWWCIIIFFFLKARNFGNVGVYSNVWHLSSDATIWADKFKILNFKFIKQEHVNTLKARILPRYHLAYLASVSSSYLECAYLRYRR